MHTRSRRLLALAGCVVASCTTPQNALHVAPEATADSLTFVLTNATGTGVVQAVYGLSVVACGTERSLWTITADGSRSIAGRILYGQPVAGFVTQVGPEPLTPGCYDVIVTGARPVRFHVDESGAIHAPPDR